MPLTWFIHGSSHGSAHKVSVIWLGLQVSSIELSYQDHTWGSHWSVSDFFIPGSHASVCDLAHTWLSWTRLRPCPYMAQGVRDLAHTWLSWKFPWPGSYLAPMEVSVTWLIPGSHWSVRDPAHTWLPWKCPWPCSYLAPMEVSVTWLTLSSLPSPPGGETSTACKVSFEQIRIRTTFLSMQSFFSIMLTRKTVKISNRLNLPWRPWTFSCRPPRA